MGIMQYFRRMGKGLPDSEVARQLYGYAMKNIEAQESSPRV
jgi:hypothetical protein